MILWKFGLTTLRDSVRTFLNTDVTREHEVTTGTPILQQYPQR